MYVRQNLKKKNRTFHVRNFLGIHKTVHMMKLKQSEKTSVITTFSFDLLINRAKFQPPFFFLQSNKSFWWRKIPPSFIWCTYYGSAIQNFWWRKIAPSFIWCIFYGCAIQTYMWRKEVGYLRKEGVFLEFLSIYKIA